MTGDKTDTKEPLKAMFELYITDVAGTTTPMGHYIDDASKYALRPEVAAKITEETGVENIESILAETAERLSEPGFKKTPLFKEAVKTLGVALNIGYRNRDLELPVYDDVRPTFENLAGAGARLRVYSSGDLESLTLGWSTTDGLDEYIETFHSSSEPETADKLSPESYRAIARDAGVDVSDMCFITDNVDEANAAVAASVGKVYFIDRKGKMELGMHAGGYEVINDYRKMAEDTLVADRAAEVSPTNKARI